MNTIDQNPAAWLLSATAEIEAHASVTGATTPGAKDHARARLMAEMVATSLVRLHRVLEHDAKARRRVQCILREVEQVRAGMG